jgi:exopolyphosphatase/guanosine-5'-triphosphate,3'-diphosphate pyrophosphatase
LGDARQLGADDQAEPPVIAAIDIGSNSIKMTVARGAAGGRPEEFAWSSETVRLGAGLESTGRLADDRIAAALAVLERFAAEARSLGAERLVAVATEATRVAANGDEFLERVGRDHGIEARAIAGAEEAELTFRGLAATVDVTGQVVVADIGGGSTELIVAVDGDLRWARSLPLGSGRLTDRLVPSDPPTGAELAACRTAAGAALGSLPAESSLPSGSSVRLFVVGGTGEYLGRLVPAEREVTRDQIAAVLERLQRVPSTRLAAELGIAEARARVLPAGVAVVEALAGEVLPGRIEIARSGIRTGLLLATFERLGQSR